MSHELSGGSFMSFEVDTDPDTLAAETRAALRHEIGPPTDRDHQWQPMVSAGEIRLLLDALDHAAPELAAARETLCRVRELAEWWESAAAPYLYGGRNHDIASDTLVARADTRMSDATQLTAALDGPSGGGGA